ncbi:molybdopterin-guanine dinucleotide biosynthesis protein B [Aquifex sp.]
MKVVAVVGYHNSGKTTLIERIIPLLKKKGYKVCYLKHDPKGHGLTDKEGSDTYRISRYVEKLGLLSPNKLTLWDRENTELFSLLKKYFSDCDIVILEGFKKIKNLPKIAVGDVEAENIVMKVDEKTSLEDIIKVIEELEERL